MTEQADREEAQTRAKLVAEIMSGTPLLGAAYYAALPMARLAEIAQRERENMAWVSSLGDRPFAAKWRDCYFQTVI